MNPEPSAWLFFKRALCLRCPECGQSRIFAPWSDTHNISQWMTPLERCPVCNYPYERESGYFLLSTWAINYGLIGGLGLMVAFYAEWGWHPPLWKTILCVAVPVVLANFFFVRHSKAFFLAFDHLVDPHNLNKPDVRQVVAPPPEEVPTQPMPPAELSQPAPPPEHSG